MKYNMIITFQPNLQNFPHCLFFALFTPIIVKAREVRLYYYVSCKYLYIFVFVGVAI